MLDILIKQNLIFFAITGSPYFTLRNFSTHCGVTEPCSIACFGVSRHQPPPVCEGRVSPMLASPASHTLLRRGHKKLSRLRAKSSDNLRSLKQLVLGGVKSAASTPSPPAGGQARCASPSLPFQHQHQQQRWPPHKALHHKRSASAGGEGMEWYASTPPPRRPLSMSPLLVDSSSLLREGALSLFLSAISRSQRMVCFHWCSLGFFVKNCSSQLAFLKFLFSFLFHPSFTHVFGLSLPRTCVISLSLQLVFSQFCLEIIENYCGFGIGLGFTLFPYSLLCILACFLRLRLMRFVISKKEIRIFSCYFLSKVFGFTFCFKTLHFFTS